MMRVLLFLGIVALAVATKVRFDNYQVMQVFPENEIQLRLLAELEAHPDEFTFWNSVSSINSSVLIMVPPHRYADFKEFATKFALHHDLYIPNVQKLIDEENPSVKSSRFGWIEYHTLDEINAWLDSLVQQFPGNVTSIVGGISYEGRQIRGVKVSFKQGNPGVFIEGGIHAREWISPASITFMLNELLTSNDPNVRDIAENYDWYIFPNLNPDGYVFSHTTNRLWRKTRSVNGLCIGADPNRNWGYHWMEGGSSSSPCSDTYAGSAPFSEIETKSMSEYITSIADKIQIYLAFHSFHQALLLPFGFSNVHISNYDVLMDIGNKAASSLAQRYGTKYVVGNIVDVLYVASGGSMDWVRGTFETPITYTYELRDTGKYGFILPADQIIPTAEETLDSVVTILQEGRQYI